MRYRSKKMAAVYVHRRRLVAQLLGEREVCEKCHDAPATEVHEVLTRARGGSILDPNNCRCLCWECHSWITEHPAESLADGWVRSSWDT